MTMPTIDDLALTFETAYRSACGFGAQPEGVFPGIMAILDKHVGPMLVEAIIEGNEIDGTVDYSTAERCAARILKSVKGE